jgi:hypothetical protein
MNTVLKVESIEKFNLIDISLSYFLVFVNFSFYIILSFTLKSKNKTILLLKYELFILFIIDIIYRISYLKTKFSIALFPKELILSLLQSAEFFFILHFLNEIPKKIQISKEEKEKDFENLEPFHNSTLFFFIIFSYDKFSLGFKNIIFLIENLLIIGSIFKIYGLLRNKVMEIILIIRNNGNDIKNKFIIGLIENIIINPLILFSLYYITKIVTIFIGNQIALTFINIISIYVKELSKYLVFVSLIIILYSLDKYVFYNKKEDKVTSEKTVKIKINQV